MTPRGNSSYFSSALGMRVEASLRYFMKDIGSDRFEALNAGVTPRGQVSPITLKVLQEGTMLEAQHVGD